MIDAGPYSICTKAAGPRGPSRNPIFACPSRLSPSFPQLRPATKYPTQCPQCLPRAAKGGISCTLPVLSLALTVRTLVDEMSGYPIVDGVTVLVLPPAGVVPDFDHPEQNKRLAHFLVFGIGGPLAFLALCQRFYTKLFLSKGLQLDDCGYPRRR